MIILTVNRGNENKYFRKSVGNALRDISKKYSEQVKAELIRGTYPPRK